MPPEPGDLVATESVMGAQAGMPSQERPQKVHDMDVLLARLGGDAVLLGEMAALFLDECPTQVSSLRQAVAGRDARKLESAAHALRGSASNFAADRTVRAALRLEQMGRKGDFTGSEQALHNLDDELERLRPVLEKWT
jgi:HPt (histidine-containing phosphotransfer) domain-containing protein